MPTRNSAKTLVGAINSILNQDFTDFEFVIVDHLSEDESPALLSDFSQSDDRIRVHRCEGSFVEAANLAWQKARGSLIARMDADDVASPDRLRQQVVFLDKHPHLAGCGSLVRILRRGPDGKTHAADEGYQRYESWVNSVISPDDILAQRFVDSPLPNPTAMIRRSVLEQLGGYEDPTWAEDYDFWLRLLEKGFQLGKVALPLLDWYDAPDRSTRNIPRYTLTKFQEAKAHFLSRLPRVQSEGVVLCGAGPIGKEMSRFLTARQIRIQAFLEVNKRQIGNQIEGVPILDSKALSEFRGKSITLGAVGQPGARKRIQTLVEEFGFVEGTDFFSVA